MLNLLLLPAGALHAELILERVDARESFLPSELDRIGGSPRLLDLPLRLLRSLLGELELRLGALESRHELVPAACLARGLAVRVELGLQTGPLLASGLQRRAEPGALRLAGVELCTRLLQGGFQLVSPILRGPHAPDRLLQLAAGEGERLGRKLHPGGLEAAPAPLRRRRRTTPLRPAPP